MTAETETRLHHDLLFPPRRVPLMEFHSEDGQKPVQILRPPVLTAEKDPADAVKTALAAAEAL